MDYQTYFENIRAEEMMNWEQVVLVEMTDALKQQLRERLHNGGEPEPGDENQPWFNEFNYHAVAAFKSEDGDYYVVWRHIGGKMTFGKVDRFDDYHEPATTWASKAIIIKRDDNGTLFAVEAAFDEDEMAPNETHGNEIIAQEMMAYTIQG